MPYSARVGEGDVGSSAAGPTPTKNNKSLLSLESGSRYWPVVRGTPSDKDPEPYDNLSSSLSDAKEGYPESAEKLATKQAEAENNKLIPIANKPGSRSISISARVLPKISKTDRPSPRS